MSVFSADDQLWKRMAWGINKIVLTVELSISNKSHNLEILYMLPKAEKLLWMS